LIDKTILMGIQCKACGHINSDEQTNCSWCKGILEEVKKSALDELILKQEQLETRHKKELADLRQELLLLRKELSTKATEASNKQLQPIQHSKPTAKPVEVKRPPIVVKQTITTPENLSKTDPPVKRIPIQQRKPSEFTLKLKNAIEPLYDGLDLISKVYKKYKTEGKLPIFFMTIAGIIALLFGVGYGMQYTISSAGIYQGIIKIGLGFAAALVAMLIGIRLTRKDTSLKEYGSALISLGVILNYVMIYYLSDLGNFPSLSSSLIGFLLIVANTGIAIALALKFEAKIIAVLFILGGAFAPFYLNADGDGRMYYLYLWFLTVGACYVSIKIKWKTLQYLAFAISALLLEIVVFVEEPSNIVFTIYYHLFAYLFFYFTFFEKGKIKNQLDRIDLVVLSANLGFFSWNLFVAEQSNLVLLGVIYLFNASVFGVLLTRVKSKLDKISKLVFLVIIGLFVGLAIPSLLSQSLMGLFWSIEAIMLIYLGFLYGNELVRKEGYFLLGFSILKLGWHSAEILYFWDRGVWHSGLVNFSILGLVITLCWALGQRYIQHFNKLEKFLFSLFREVVPIWLAVIFFIMSYGFFGIWSFPLAVGPLFGLVYWSKLFKTEVTVWFAYGHLFLLVLAAFISLAETNSIHFLDQRLFAQVSIVELIASLWLLKGYYKWLKLESDFSYGLASALRVTFFCLVPLLFINFSRKIDFSFFGPAIWLSVLIAYFLFIKLKHLALKIEAILLVGFAMLFILTFLDLVGMFFGVGVLIGLAIFEQSNKEAQFLSSQIKSFLGVIPYLLMVLLWFVSFKVLGEDFSVSCVISSLFLIILVIFKNHLAIVSHSYIFATRLSIILLFVTYFSFLISQSNLTPVLVMVYLLFLGVLLYNKQNWYDLEKKINRWNFAFALHQLLIIMGVAIFIDWVGINVQGPISSVLLVIHAIILVFIALKQRSKFINKISMVLFIMALLKVLTNDISDFSMPQKVIVFLILGLLLLAASYGYVKLKKKFEEKEELTEVETKIIDPKIEIEE